MVCLDHARCTVDICDLHVCDCLGNSDTSLLLLKGHVDKPVNSDGMF